MGLRRFPLRAAGALAAVLSLALVASCGAIGKGPGNDAAPLAAINPFGSDHAAEGTPKSGGTLLLGMDREIVSFDPTVQNSNMAALAVYDSLMKLTPNGSAEPYLAQSMDSPDGGSTWRLVLRPGVKFSDGTDLDADAVMVNVQRHIDKVSSPAHAYAAQIASMRAVGPTTVEFALKSPSGAFPMVFAQPITYGSLGMIVSPAALQKYGKDIGSNPVGAGPFKFVSWVRDSKLVLARNPGYWQAGKPYLDGLEFRPLPDTESRYASIQNGDVDVIFGGYNDELVRGIQDPKLKVYYGPGNAGEYLYFNFNRAPFNDRRMREAIIRALDLNALGASQYNGRLVHADSLFDADSPYHTQAASDAWPKFDPERARQLIQEYQASGGNPNFTFKTTTARRPFAEYIQAQLAAVGLNVKVEFYDLAQFSSSVVQSNDFELTTWVGAFDSPYPGAMRLLRTGANTNYGKYSNPQVDALLDQAASTTDESVRKQAYQQVELIAGADLAVAFFSRSYLSTITKADVKGIDRYGSRDMFYATTWLDR
ncbi:ABC transporter substrate-binding protein [Saccharopolyspora sp. K220]|uniref:ABC transporter substrate-binding protein n=1 Tax=Saccharopolyspora soli TaxID=2926618 RepID=UPI001F5A1F05|nr:ABC transporter substrate-binding protein [Saccharopolyspora soli]MCI2419554.1 ABC transporter substrate-binding protein [Saccharopolyspora soli]